MKKPKPTCGARPRNVATNARKNPCQCKMLLKGQKCRFHGGMSTGPRTPEGKAAVTENLRFTPTWKKRAGQLED